MKKDLENKSNIYAFIIKLSIINVITTAAFIFLFAAVIYLTESFYEYATVLATISVSMGAFITAFYTAKKIGKRGILIGAEVGGVIFCIITAVSLFTDKGSLTANTLFHFIIIMLASIIGGILGVNKGSNKKYKL